MARWARRPSRSTATSRPIDSASAWSWVTSRAVRAFLAQGVQHRFARLAAQRGIQAGEGLVEQDDARSRRERPGERDAPLLAAGELVRGALGIAVIQADQLERLGDPGPPLALRAREPEADVLAGAEVGKQGAFLGDVADRPLVG